MKSEPIKAHNVFGVWRLRQSDRFYTAVRHSKRHERDHIQSKAAITGASIISKFSNTTSGTDIPNVPVGLVKILQQNKRDVINCDSHETLVATTQELTTVIGETASSN
jgi:hypothetical protein